MGNFNKFDRGQSSRSFGGPRFGGGQKFGGPSAGNRQKFSAVCSKCGQNCEVPFKPTDRPVFCSNCFKSQGVPNTRFSPPSFGGGNRGGSLGSSSGNGASISSGNAISKVQFDSLNFKLDKILALLSSTKVEEKAPEVKVQEVKSAKKISVKAPILAKKPKAKKK